MKFIATIIAAISIAAITVQAEIGYSSFASGSSAVGTTNYVIIPNLSKANAQPVVNFLSATGTNTSAAVNYYYSKLKATVTATNATNIVYINSTNSWAAGDVIVIQHNKAGTLPRLQYERRQVASVGATNLVVAPDPTYACLPGDLVWQETKIGSIPVGVATANTAVTLTITGSCMTGERNQPLLVDDGGVGNTTINGLNAIFVQ